MTDTSPGNSDERAKRMESRLRSLGKAKNVRVLNTAPLLLELLRLHANYGVRKTWMVQKLLVVASRILLV
jgi:hypothetical protein